MSTVHMWVGTFVVIGYLALTVIYGLQLSGGRTIAWTYHLSRTAATLLLIQFGLGFAMLGGDHSITPFHYLIALCAILTVGTEHSVANSAREPSERARLVTLAAAGSTVLVLIAYAIGQSS